MLVLSTRHAALAKLASKDNLRYTTAGVHVEDKGDGRYALSATDCRILARVTGQNVATPAIVGVESLPNGGTTGIIGSKAFAAALKPAGRKTEEIALAMTPPVDPTTDGMAGRFTFATTNGTTTGDLTAGRFPAVDGVFPREPIAASVTIDPALLAKLLTAAADLGIEHVTIELRTKIGHKGDVVPMPVVLRGTNDHGETFDAIIMPISK